MNDAYTGNNVSALRLQTGSCRDHPAIAGQGMAELACIIVNYSMSRAHTFFKYPESFFPIDCMHEERAQLMRAERVLLGGENH